MSRARELKAIISRDEWLKINLPDATILVSEFTLSYVKCLIPEWKSRKMILLHGELQLPPENLERKKAVSQDLETSDLDITGSPLEYKLDYSLLDETINNYRNWKKEEEFHTPLTKIEAREALNCCIEYFDNQDWSLPLLALCDGKDNSKTLLLGSCVKNGWFTTIKACVMASQRSANIKELPAKLLKEYTKMFSVPKAKVSVAVGSTYELCGMRPGIIDSTDISPSCFTGSLSVEVNWNTLSFDAPIKDSTSTLIMHIIAGWNGSHLQKLWKELMTLYQYLNILEQQETDERNSYTFASSNSVTWEEIEEKLNSLLNGEDEDTTYKYSTNINHSDMELKEHVNNVMLRKNRDFSDMMWELLKSCSDSVQVTKCIHTVLEKIQSSCAGPQMAMINSTRINNLIRDILNKKGVAPILYGNLPLELMIDTGLEKLSQDYRYILLNARLMNYGDIQQTLQDNVHTGSFNIANYRKKLILLAHIHLSLEFTLFSQNHLFCSTENVKLIFTYAFQEYVCKNSTIKSFLELLENQMQRLEVAIPTKILENIAESLPSSWYLTLSSESRYSKMTMTSHLSRTPILPPNVYCFDKCKEDDVYHFLRLNLSANKIS